MNAKETIIIVIRMPSVQIRLVPINASAGQDIPVMVFHAQVIAELSRARSARAAEHHG